MGKGRVLGRTKEDLGQLVRFRLVVEVGDDGVCEGVREREEQLARVEQAKVEKVRRLSAAAPSMPDIVVSYLARAVSEASEPRTT